MLITTAIIITKLIGDYDNNDQINKNKIMLLDRWYRSYYIDATTTKMPLIMTIMNNNNDDYKE